MAGFDGAPWFEWATMPHPTAELRGDAIAAAARLVVPAIERVLLQQTRGAFTVSDNTSGRA